MNDATPQPKRKPGRPRKITVSQKDIEAEAAAEALCRSIFGDNVEKLEAKVKVPVPVTVDGPSDKDRQDEIADGRRKVIAELLSSQVDEFGFTNCPGAEKHTTRTSYRDFRVFGLRGKRPMGQCFHSQCREVVDAFNERMAEAFVLHNLHFWPWEEDTDTDAAYKKRHKKVGTDHVAIKTIAESVPESVNREWLKANSPINVDKVDSHGFLTALYPGNDDRVLIFDNETSQGQLVWYPKIDPSWQQKFRHHSRKGVWFLVQPVGGAFVNVPRLRTPFNPAGRTRRAAECVTEFRYLVLESDNVDEDTWVKVLVNLPLPVVSVVTSGSRSLHALIWVGAKKQQEWEDYRYDIEKIVTSLGCDQGALKAVQLSRLPGCLRHVKFDKSSEQFVGFEGGPRKQELLYLNPTARGIDSVWTLAKHSNA